MEFLHPGYSSDLMNRLAVPLLPVTGRASLLRQLSGRLTQNVLHLRVYNLILTGQTETPGQSTLSKLYFTYASDIWW